jgi:hypothetical protein
LNHGIDGINCVELFDIVFGNGQMPDIGNRQLVCLRFSFFTALYQAIPQLVIPAKFRELAGDLTNRGTRAGIQNNLIERLLQ